MSPEDVSLPIAFLAGLLSFLSPCVLPLVPAYVGFLGGEAALSGTQAAGWRGALCLVLNALVFVLGFSLVFVALGASATLVGRLLLTFRPLLARTGGVLLVVFGLRVLGTGWRRRTWIAAAVAVALLTFVAASGWLSREWSGFEGEWWRWLAESLLMGLVALSGMDQHLVRQIVLGAGAGVLNYLASFSEPVPRAIESLLIAALAVLFNRAEVFYGEKRLTVDRAGRAGPARSALFGVVFAAGWTPCLGPILAAILGVASGLDTVGEGVLLLGAYSVGLAVPFLLVALGVALSYLVVGLALQPLTGRLGWLRRTLGAVSVLSGTLLVVMGILFFTDGLAFLAQYGNLIDVEL